MQWPVEALRPRAALVDLPKLPPFLGFRVGRGGFVLAVADGRVRQVHEDAATGLTIVIDHDNGWTSTYARVGASLVTARMPVERGAAIAVANPQLNPDGLGLWFGLHHREHAVDPGLIFGRPWPRPR